MSYGKKEPIIIYLSRNMREKEREWERESERESEWVRERERERERVVNVNLLCASDAREKFLGHEMMLREKVENHETH